MNKEKKWNQSWACMYTILLCNQKNMNSIAWVHILGKSIKNNRATVTYTSCESPPIFKPSASTNN